MVIVEQGGVTMSLRFLDEDSLRLRFGAKANPFLTDYGRVMLRRNVVFELTINNRGPSSFRFEQQNCELQYGGKTVPPLNRFQQSSDVDLRDEDIRLRKPKKDLIERYVLPNRATLASGSVLSGFLLFQGNFPVKGEAIVSIPGAAEGEYFQFNFSF